jgi:hypothetical protein
MQPLGLRTPLRRDSTASAPEAQCASGQGLERSTQAGGHKLRGWAATLAGVVQLVVYDECQALRSPDTEIYKAANLVAQLAPAAGPVGHDDLQLRQRVPLGGERAAAKRARRACRVPARVVRRLGRAQPGPLHRQRVRGPEGGGDRRHGERPRRRTDHVAALGRPRGRPARPATTFVFGEIDWSPGVHKQCIGRVHRDGQDEPCTAYFLLSEAGAGPIMAGVLGMKRDRLKGCASLKWRSPSASTPARKTFGGSRTSCLPGTASRNRTTPLSSCSQHVRRLPTASAPRRTADRRLTMGIHFTANDDQAPGQRGTLTIDQAAALLNTSAETASDSQPPGSAVPMCW